MAIVTYRERRRRCNDFLRLSGSLDSTLGNALELSLLSCFGRGPPNLLEHPQDSSTLFSRIAKSNVPKHREVGVGKDNDDKGRSASMNPETRMPDVSSPASSTASTRLHFGPPHRPGGVHLGECEPGELGVKTCAKKRTEVGATARSGVRDERGLRGPHGVVKSIRPSLEPRLLALLTVVRRERHQRDWEDLEDVGKRGQGLEGQE
ncbi:hypothetical protein KM043_006576 [Ampulex compressa]|nr:hypothetical protein KM043_006576 [Ampulex compressa]